MIDTLLPLKPVLHMPRRDVWLPAFGGHKVEVPAFPNVVDPLRRERGGESLRAFKRIYFPNWVLEQMSVDAWVDDPNGKFHGVFLDALESSIRATAIRYEAWAVSRGLGKTTDAEVATVWAALYKLRKMILWISLNGPDAEKRVGAVKHICERNPLLLEDFPELMQPIRNFNGDPRGAHSEKMVWTGTDLRFTNGVHVAGRGIDGQIRGFNVDMVRPDLVFPDDIENEYTIRSEAETSMRRAKMEKEVSFLHGQGAGITRCSYVLIGTIPGVGCLTDEYTNQDIRPDWNGRRMGAMTKKPTHPERWDKFKEAARLKKDAETDADRAHFVEAGPAIAVAVGMNPKAFADEGFGTRKALEIYAADKVTMDEGIEMLEPLQLPAWMYFRTLAEKGEAHVASELDCAPLQAEGISERALDKNYIVKKRTLTPAFLVPRWCKHVFVTVDVQMHCLWVEADACNADLDTPQVLEFGKLDTGMNRDGAFSAIPNVEHKRQRVDQVIFDTLMRLHRRLSLGWKREGTGELVFPSLIGVDCGGTTPLAKHISHAWYKAVLDFCRPQNSGGKWVALKGEKWSKSAASAATEQDAANWILRKDSEGRIDCNADHWKTQHFNELQAGAGAWTSGDMPPRGSKYIHADEGFRVDEDGQTKIYSDPISYSRHCSAEKFVVELRSGVNVENSEKIGWQPVTLSGQIAAHTRDNHGWDTGWMQCAIRDIFKWRSSRQESLENALKAAQHLPKQNGPKLPNFVQRERF